MWRDGFNWIYIFATIKCKKINSSQIKYNKTLNENLDNLFKCFDKHSDLNYSVAWLYTKKISLTMDTDLYLVMVVFLRIINFV